ncbi:MAG: hypothetical protein ACI8TQ_002121 [Planctomycetota bacterium]
MGRVELGKIPGTAPGAVVFQSLSPGFDLFDEARRATMSTRLESFDQMRARVLTLLVPDACHKLNNSVAVISGMAELTMHSSGKVNSVDSLQLVFDHSRRVAKQLTRLSFFALSTSLEIGVEDAGNAYADAAGLLTPIFEVTGTRFECESAELTYPVKIDRRRLMQVLVVLACCPLLPSDPDNFNFETQPKLETVRLSIGYSETGTAIEVGLPANCIREAEAAVELVRSTLAEFEAGVSVQRQPNETVLRVSMNGIE